MQPPDIRRVTPLDIAALQQIGRETFSETFSAANTPENMAKYLGERFSSGKLTGEVADSNSEFYFAVVGGRVVGYLKVNSRQSQTELRDEEGIEIERIYVLEEFHGRKIGQALYEKALEVAARMHARYVWLGVWEHNPRAMNFYRKHGFVEFSRHIFQLGDDAQTDIMMKLELVQG